MRETHTESQNAQEDKEHVLAFLKACEENDAQQALRLAKEKTVPKAYLRHGLENLLTTNQNYEGLEALFKPSGIVDSNNEVDRAFITKTLSAPKDMVGAVLFLNGMQAKYDLEDFQTAVFSGGDEAGKIMIDGGNFDVKQNHSQSLAYACVMNRKDIFNSLLEKGASAADAVSFGSNDLRWNGTYAKLAEWAEDFYKNNPSMKPEQKAVIPLGALAERKENMLTTSIQIPRQPS